MKKNLLYLISLLFCLVIPVQAGEQLAAKDKRAKKILFIAGHPSHKNGEHEFRAGSMYLADSLNKSGLNVEAKVQWYGWPKDESIFNGVDVCVVYADKGGAKTQKNKDYLHFTGENYAFLNDKVKNGMSIVFLHYGVHPTEAVGERYFLDWIGGYFNDKQSINSTWVANLKVKKNHPVARGIPGPVTALDEFYFNIKMPHAHGHGICTECYPLATDTPTIDKIIKFGGGQFQTQAAADAFNTEQAIMWCRDSKDQGRGIGFSGGHFHHNWAIEGISKMVLNAIVWSARLDVPAEGVNVIPMTVESLNENLDRPSINRRLKLPTDKLLRAKRAEVPKEFEEKINKQQDN